MTALRRKVEATSKIPRIITRRDTTILKFSQELRALTFCVEWGEEKEEAGKKEQEEIK